LVVAADEPKIEQAAQGFRKLGATVEAVEADLATLEGVDKLYAAAKGMGRPVDALLANAGRGLGKGFLDQDFGDVMRVINTNITGTFTCCRRSGVTCANAVRGASLLSARSPASHAGHLPGGLQRHQGLSRFFFVRAAP
jgi:short-subunit dehydrogenase